MHQLGHMSSPWCVGMRVPAVVCALVSDRDFAWACAAHVPMNENVCVCLFK